MNWYWAVECANTVAKPLVVNSHDFFSIDDSRLWLGKALEGWNQSSWMRATSPKHDGEPDDVLQNHLGLPVFSARLQTALRDAGIAGMQFLQVRVRRPMGEEIEGFAVANVAERGSALDRVRSDIELFPDDYFNVPRRGGVRAVRRTVLVARLLPGCDVFRLEEFFPNVYVSQRFVDVFVQGEFTGFEFHQVGLS